MNKSAMKIKIFASIILALAVLPGATVWEGAAAVAPAGDLPENGFYAATNSFPRNTVVDITNLENGKSIRVIVASGLETPGLLAVLSRNAADMIGLPVRSVGRIRISQPSDPVAFSRFTEGLASSGDPDFDPSGMTVDESALAPAPVPQTPPSRPAFSFVPESEWADDSYSEIIDLPETSAPPSVAADDSVTDDGIRRESAPVFISGDETVPENAEDAGLAAAEESAAVEEPAAAEVAEAAVEENAGTETADVSEYVSAMGEAAPAVDAGSETAAPAETVPEPRYDYALLPADERPPQTPVDAGETAPDEALFIDPVEPAQAAAEPEPVAEPEGPFIAALDSSAAAAPSEMPAVTAPAETSAPVIAAPAVDVAPAVYAPPANETRFSVPVISALEAGKYYVQLGSFSRAELVQDEITRIGNFWPLAIQKAGNDEKPLYRILLGPLNIGEGGAVLQRFKSIGYKDAYLRQN